MAGCPWGFAAALYLSFLPGPAVSVGGAGHILQISGLKSGWIALDGWVLPESAAVAGSSVGAAVSDYYVGVIREEIALAGEIAKRLPPGSIVMNTIGRSMLESLNDLNSATAYFSHVGTLQHKLGLLLSLPGVVHGPKSQVSDPEGGSYLSEEGVSPVFMPENLVEDIPTLSIRGQSFADYRILDVAFPTERLSQLMK